MADQQSFADALLTVGISVPELVAGFCGGVSHVLFMRVMEPFEAIGLIIGGALTANYLSPLISHQIGTTGYVTPFIVGLAGMQICRGILEWAKNWRIGKSAKDNAP